jgi:carbon monoxide dehydrogenase subunit G
MTWRKALLAIALIATGAVPARALLPDDTAALAAGEPVVTVDTAGKTVQMSGSIDVPAPPKTVWAAIYDCAATSRLLVGLESCRVLKQGPDGLWDVREHVFSFLWLVKIRNVVRTDYEPPKRMQFEETEDGQLDKLKGEVRLDALPDGGTRLVFRASLAADLGPFNFMLRGTLRHDITTALRNVRKATAENERQ